MEKEFLNPDDGGSIFLRITDTKLHVRTALQLRW